MTTEELMEHYITAAKLLVIEAEKNGVIITVERKSVPPLAMRNHVAVVEVRAKR